LREEWGLSKFRLVRSSAPSCFAQAQRRSSVSDLLPTYDAILHYIFNKNDMKPLPTEGYTGLYFTTATIKGWKHLLKPDKYKTIVTDAMTFLAERQEVWFYAFVIMPNHIHWIWQLQGETVLSSVQQRMLKYVAGQIRIDLQMHHPLVLGRKWNTSI
jgi:REP element-mobilizing transposase RayT